MLRRTMVERIPERRAKPGMTQHPRKVRGGVRVLWREGQGPAHWIARQVLAFVREHAPPGAAEEGLEYARRGQTLRIEQSGGTIAALVQGRAERPYAVRLALTPIPSAEWLAAIESMAGQAIYSAKLLSGDLPEELDGLLAASGSTLSPSRASDATPSCSCGTAGWCKHACCLASVLADRLDREPFLIFELRGMRSEDLISKLREKRGTGERRTVTAPVYEPRVPDAPFVRGRPLEECVRSFWEAGPELQAIETPLAPPAVSHPLLRRLGPSPFREFRFPLLGLLATCYDVASRAALERTDEGGTSAETGEQGQAGGGRAPFDSI